MEEYNVGALGTTYRFYVNAEDASDKISAVFGNDQMPLVINTPDGIYNDAFNTSWNASGINSALFGFFPDLEDDSYATIGLEGSCCWCCRCRRSFLGSGCFFEPTVSSYFQAGGTELNVNTLTGASWYVLNTAANALAHRRTLVGCSNHHHRFHFWHPQLPDLPDWVTVQTKSRSRSTSTELENSLPS